MSTLTRHFYTLDEVHAALHDATTRNDRTETVFWCYELVRSGWACESISTLFEAWLWNKGPFCLSWLLGAKGIAGDEVSEESILLSAYQLSAIPYTRRDYSLWNILVLTAANTPPDRVTPKTPPNVPFTDQTELCMVRAMYQGKAYTAWWMSLHLEPDRVWTIIRWHLSGSPNMMTCLNLLEEYESLLGYRTEEYNIVIRCTAVLIACLSPSQQERSLEPLCTMDARMHQTIAEWDKECGKKSHRRYTIPSRCLYGKTKRGTMCWLSSTVADLGKLEEKIRECPYWLETMEEYLAANGHWKSDDKREAFYVRHFPDDVPDEWSKTDKDKSHGDGVLGPNETISMAKWARSFFTHTSRFAWCATATVQHFLKTKEGHLHPSEIVQWFPPMTAVDPNQIRPVHRRVIV